jgi:hypothetical protein
MSCENCANKLVNLDFKQDSQGRFFMECLNLETSKTNPQECKNDSIMKKRIASPFDKDSNFGRVSKILELAMRAHLDIPLILNVIPRIHIKERFKLTKVECEELAITTVFSYKTISSHFLF